jgi:hypothetical protein
MPSITNKIENFDFLNAQELSSSHGLPKSGTFLIHPQRVILNQTVKVQSNIVKELSVFSEIYWLDTGIYNLQLPVVRVVGIKKYDFIYEVIQGKEIIAAAIHLKMKLITVILLRDEHIHQLQANGVLGGE